MLTLERMVSFSLPSCLVLFLFSAILGSSAGRELERNSARIPSVSEGRKLLLRGKKLEEMELLLPPVSAEKTIELNDEEIASPFKHHGPVLSNTPLPLYIIWYGKWAQSDQLFLKEFLSSFHEKDVSSGLFFETTEKGDKFRLRGRKKDISAPLRAAPSLFSWWKTTWQYRGITSQQEKSAFVVKEEASVSSETFGISLTRNSTNFVLRAALAKFGGSLPFDSDGLYLVLTGPEIYQEDFCSTACGFHSYTAPDSLVEEALGKQAHFEENREKVASEMPNEGLRSSRLVYAWVGNAAQQCPEFCGFPFAAPPYLPEKFATLVSPPSGDQALDSMVAIMAHELAEATTDPFMTGWYTGNREYPLEIADACIGIFGEQAFPGSPGKFFSGRRGEGYNVVGGNGKKYLVPWLWSSSKHSCVGYS